MVKAWLSFHAYRSKKTLTRDAYSALRISGMKAAFRIGRASKALAVFTKWLKSIILNA